MFHAYELRFVTMLLVLLAQIFLTLLSLANIVIAQLSGSFVMLPAFIIATNALMSIALLVLMILDWKQNSPMSIQSEIILSATAGGIDLISAIAILFFKSSEATCDSTSNSSFWNICGAHFAILSLLWTATFLLLAYAVTLFCTAWRYSSRHPLAEKPVWKQTVKETCWSRETISPGNSPGSRLRKRSPLDIESLRRVIRDEDSKIVPRQMGSFSTSSPSVKLSRPVARPPGLDSPVGFAERMGYFRRDAHGEYIASTPTISRESLPTNPHRTRSEEIEGGTVFTMQTPQLRRPSHPDSPNGFPPRSIVPAASSQSSPPLLDAAPSNRSRSSSHSSARSGKGSDPGFAGLGAGAGSSKAPLSVSIPVVHPSALRRSLEPSSARSAKTPISSETLGQANQRLFRISAPMTPASALSIHPPRQSLQPSRVTTTPASPHLRQFGARSGYGSQHQPRSHASLAATVSTITGLESAYGFNPMLSRTNRPKSQYGGDESARLQGPFLQVPQPTLSPSTRQRVSNAAYPLPLPPLSTYPIKSIAQQALHTPNADPTKPQGPAIDLTSASTLHPKPLAEQHMKERPISTVSSVSCYSTSSASHGPVPPREIFGPAVSAIPVEIRCNAQESAAAPKRRLSRPKTPPTLSRVPSQHGMNPQNTWGGTGNGPARRSLAAQFHQPRAGSGWGAG